MWAWRCLLASALVMATFTVASSASNIARSAGLLRDMGSHGLTLGQTEETPWGWSEVLAVAPRGAAAKAGVVRGDLVKFDGVFGYSIGYGPPPTRPSEPVQITIDRDGRRFHRAITYPPGAPYAGTEPLVALNAINALVMTAFGAILLIRGRRNRRAVMLGMILLYLAIATSRLFAWVPTFSAAQVRVAIAILSVAAMGWFWPQFSLEISGGAATQRQARRIKAGALALVAVGVAAATASRLPVAPRLADAAQVGWLAFVGGIWLFGFAIIAGNYRRNDPPARNRIHIVAVAFVCYLLAQALNQTVSALLAAGYPPIQGFWLGTSAASLSLIGLGLLVYAVLGQRLFDIGFALNRTLVYGVVSFILLAGFGLAEWGVERLLPHAWHEGGAFFSAGIALALFLSFHRLRDWVEKHVERLLFRSWHRNEAALRRFAASAGHFEQTLALCRAFAEEVSRFAQGAGAAVYLRSPGAGYRRCAGKLPGARPAYLEEDRAFALMRAERRSLNLAEAHSALPGILALPMLDRGSLAGFVLLDRKRDGADYRPDEIDALERATAQVGFALQAQHVHELEARIASLDAGVGPLADGKVALAAPR
jgi:hypothetical protein